MALIRSYVHPTIGCTINVYDDYLPKTPEERAERHRELGKVVARMMQNPQTRENLRKYNREHYGDE